MNFYDREDFYCHKCAIQLGENIKYFPRYVVFVFDGKDCLNLGGKFSGLFRS